MNSFFLLFLATLAIAADEATIDIPKSGWRNSTGQSLGTTQPANYPVVDVSVSENQNPYALIKGTITGNPKDKPATLIVNGIALPMKTNENGEFQRPYLFGYGSNNVEIRNAKGKPRSRTQFFEANRLAKRSRLSVIMSWDSDSTDLDLHVVSPDGEHTFYGARQAKNGGSLDVDVTDGYGPEIYSTPVPLKGRYLVYANYYGAGRGTDLTTATITVVTNQNTPDEKVETMLTSMRTPGELNFVYAFDVR